jgi:hypothetical protein
MLRFANIERDQDLVELAQQLSQQMMVEDSALVDRHLNRWFGDRSALANV